MHEYEIGCEIRNKLVTNAVSWYTGKAVADEDNKKEEPAADLVRIKHRIQFLYNKFWSFYYCDV